MEAIISAEQCLKNVLIKYLEAKKDSSKDRADAVNEAMLEFAKLHREAILKEIAEDYTYYLKGDEGSETLDEEKFFKEVYPINNIK
jgi:hypothetical protein